jgi:hypothetical protein
MSLSDQTFFRFIGVSPERGSKLGIKIPDMSALSLLEELDQMRRELQNDHPGWQIWYVFHHDGSATWHARPKPWLNAPSPDDLRKLISEATRVSELTPA